MLAVKVALARYGDMSSANLNVVGIRQVIVFALDKRLSVKANENIRLNRLASVGDIANRHEIGVVNVGGKNIKTCRCFPNIAGIIHTLARGDRSLANVNVI